MSNETEIEIVLDAGHGGADSGATYKELIEKNINLIVALRCKNELERNGVKVLLTRTSDTYLSIGERCSIANKAKAKYCISIHCNAGGGDRGEVIHSIYRGKGLELSNKISKELMDLGQSTVKIYEKKSFNDTDYYGIIRGTAMDTIIVECAFLDNEVDNDILDTLAEQEAFGVAIARGIVKQLGKTYTEPIKPNYGLGSFGVVTADLLNVRNGRGTDKAIIGQIKQGTKVKLCYLKDNWWSIDFGKDLGYVSAEFIKRV